MSERLKQETVAKIQSMLRLVQSQGASLRALRQYAVRNNLTAAVSMIMEIQGLQCSLQAEANGIEVELKAATSCGEVELRSTVRADELELHPGYRPFMEGLVREVVTGERAPSVQEIEAMQASLHRAGDHTQDSGEGEV
jgi:hypothetical protein